MHIVGKSAMIIEVVCVLQTWEVFFLFGLRLHQSFYQCGRKEIIRIGELFSSAIFETGKVRRERSRCIPYSVHCV